MAHRPSRSQQQQQFVGIDVSKDKLDAYLDPAGQRIGVANDDSGVAQLIEQLRPLDGVQRVVVEATGHYERRVVMALLEAGIAVWAIVRAREAGMGSGSAPRA